MVVATGNSDRQLRALTDYVRIGVKEHFNKAPFGVDGTPESGWVLLDYGEVIVHLFTRDLRDFYDIETLWRERAKVMLSIQ
jgi:ribosome-associated protein